MSEDAYTPTSPHVLELDGYEVANLQTCLAFVHHVGGDTGDWHAQVLHKLLQFDVREKPNKSVHEQRRELALKTGWGMLW